MISTKFQFSFKEFFNFFCQSFKMYHEYSLCDNQLWTLEYLKEEKQKSSPDYFAAIRQKDWRRLSTLSIFGKI